MEVRCHTPFVPFSFKSRDAEDRSFDVFVVKATYDLVDDQRVKISQDQEPITVADRYYGEVNVTSVARESDLKPFKPRTDVVVVGDGHAPRGKPAQSFFVEARLGDVHKALRVHGERSWRRKMGMFWSLTDPEPCVTVPIRYEHAFGGTFATDEGVQAYAPNPVGVGFAPARVAGETDELPAPRIEDPHDVVMDFGREHHPVGFGWIGRAWQPRLALAGTYDDAWKESQWPLPPRDFDDAYHNGAHPDLLYPTYLRGGEPFSAMNMTPSGSVSFEVPSWRVDIRVRYRDGNIERYPTNIDTLIVDLSEQKVVLVHRVRVPEAGPIRVVEVCMTRGE